MTTAIQTNTFFCHTCLTDRPVDEQSSDPRYCQYCFDYLNNHEVPLLSGFPIKPKWMPKVQKVDVQKIPENPITPPTLPPTSAKSAVVDLVRSDGIKQGRPAKTPELSQLILKMADKCPNGNQIFEQLNKQHVKVSRRTVYNILAGQRGLL